MDNMYANESTENLIIDHKKGEKKGSNVAVKSMEYFYSREKVRNRAYNCRRVTRRNQISSHCLSCQPRVPAFSQLKKNKKNKKIK